MIDFQKIGESDRPMIASRLDRYLVFRDTRAFPLILRAAEARIAFLADRDEKPYALDDYLVKLPATTERIAINAQGVVDFSNMLGQYVTTNYLFNLKPGEDMAEVREEAETLAKELVLAAGAYEAAQTADFDGFLRSLSTPSPGTDPA